MTLCIQNAYIREMRAGNGVLNADCRWARFTMVPLGFETMGCAVMDKPFRQRAHEEELRK